MQCPIANINVGNECIHQDCWLWHHKAKGNCVADDVGNTHILPIDVARIYKEPIEATNERIERGRSKMAAWLQLLDKLEEVQGNEINCENCGAPKCKKKDNCIARQHRIAKLKNLPFEELIEMNPSRWFYALRAKDNANLVFSIKLNPDL